MSGPTRRAPRGPIGVVVALALVVSVAVTVGPARPRPAHAANGACPDANGVTVVVDFRALGGSTIVRCAVGPVEDGLDALRKVGVAYDTSMRHPGLVCRIEGKPADEPCQAAPPSDYYWSYWYAEHGDDWTYATKGASSRTPPPGSSEGWSFSTDASDDRGSPPRTAPTTYAVEPEPAPSPTPSPEPSPTPPPPPPPPEQEPGAEEPAPPPVAPPPSGADPVADPDASTDAPPEEDAAAAPSATPRPSPTRTPRATPSPTPTATPSPDVAVLADSEEDGGSAAGTVLGVLLIAGLAGAAGYVAWRRRREVAR